VGPVGCVGFGRKLGGELAADYTRSPPTTIHGSEKDVTRCLLLVTVDLSKKPSNRYWGGPIRSSADCRRARKTWIVPLEWEIAERWHEDKTAERHVEVTSCIDNWKESCCMRKLGVLSLFVVLVAAFGIRAENGGAADKERLGKIRFEYKTEVQKGNYYEEALRVASDRFHKQLHWVRMLAPWAEQVDPGYRHASAQAVERFRDFKFGLRIHWGVYSMNGSNPSWSLWRPIGQLGGADPSYPSRGLSNLDYVEYIKRYCTFYQDFNPTGFNADEWADMMKRAGFQFFVFTTKHHDGFSMFHTKTFVNALQRDGEGSYENVLIHYSLENTRFRRDVLRELVDSARKRDLGIGLYFSNPDWLDYDGRFAEHSLFRDPTYTRQSDPEGWKRFLARHREQLQTS